MNTNIKKHFTVATLVFLLIVFIFPLVSTAGSPTLKDAFKINSGNNKDPLDAAASTAGYDTNKASTQIDSTIAKIINTALSLLGVIFLVLMIYGGYLWMIARGDEAQVTKAKNIITAAVIGVIIVVSAYAITYFLIERLGQDTLSNSPNGNTNIDATPPAPCPDGSMPDPTTGCS